MTPRKLSPGTRLRISSLGMTVLATGEICHERGVSVGPWITAKDGEPAGYMPWGSIELADATTEEKGTT